MKNVIIKSLVLVSLLCPGTVISAEDKDSATEADHVYSLYYEDEELLNDPDKYYEDQEYDEEKFEELLDQKSDDLRENGDISDETWERHRDDSETL